MHDVIGGAYDLETRVWSNYKNNKAKAEKEKKRREEEAAKKAEEEASTKQGTERHRENGENERSNKRTKIQPSSSPDADRSINDFPASISDGAIIKSTSSSTSSVAIQKLPRKTLQPRKVTAATKPARQRASSSATVLMAIDGASSNEASLPTAASTKKGKAAKRRIEDVDEVPEPPTASVKKRKTGSRPKAAPKGNAKGKAAAGDDSSGYGFEAPATRRKTHGKSASTTRTKRTSTRSKKTAAGSSAVAEADAGASSVPDLIE